MSSPRRLSLDVAKKRLSDIKLHERRSAYSTYLQSAVQPTQSMSNMSHAPSTSTTLSSPLGKSSHVQQMWFHGHLGNTRLSKEELSQNIAAMLDEDHRPNHSSVSGINENSPNITLLVGELVHSSPSPENAEIQINRVKLSNICSPRTVYSGRIMHSATELRGRKIVVAVLNNLSLNHSKGTFSEGVILCDRTGNLIDPGRTSRVGGQLKLIGNGQIMKHLQFSAAGFANLSHGQLSNEDGSVVPHE